MHLAEACFANILANHSDFTSKLSEHKADLLISINSG